MDVDQLLPTTRSARSPELQPAREQAAARSVYRRIRLVGGPGAGSRFW